MGSRFKGYRDVIVQDLIITPHNRRYRLAQYVTPEGTYVTGHQPEHSPFQFIEWITSGRNSHSDHLEAGK